MRCAWQAFLNLLPLWMRQTVDLKGKDSLLELRLRLNQTPELVTAKGQQYLDRDVSADDLRFVVNTASDILPGRLLHLRRGISRHPEDIELVCAEWQSFPGVK